MAFAMDKGDLQRLLDRNPINREDLKAILKSGQLSKQEIKDLLNDCSGESTSPSRPLLNEKQVQRISDN